MKTITISAVFSLCFLLLGCSYSINTISNNERIKGEGEVVSEQIVLENFRNLKLERGWEVHLIPASSNYMIIEANENLFEVLEYDNTSGNLKIGSSKQISSADSKSIQLYFTDKLESLKVSSGTKVSSKERLNFDDLKMDLSSGCDVNLDLELKSLDLETSSGSDAYLVLNLDDLTIDSSSGSSANIEAQALSTKVNSSSGAEVILKGNSGLLDIKSSSGSSVNSKVFEAEKVTAKASSGASISVYPIEDLTATISSGGDVYYYNKPSGRQDFNKSKSGGSIKMK